MVLSAETFEQIIKSLRAECEREASPDHRRSARMGFDVAVPMVLINPPGKIPLDVKVRNLSASGVGILAPRPLRPNNRFALRFAVGKEGGIWILYNVIHSKPAEDGRFGVGGKMIQVVDLGDLHATHLRDVATALSDRRD